MSNAWRKSNDRGFLVNDIQEMRKEWLDLKVGDEVLLKYTGYSRVPKTISGYWATIVSRNKRGNLVVQSSIELDKNRTIRISDISDWRRGKDPTE